MQNILTLEIEQKNMFISKKEQKKYVLIKE